MEAARTRLAQRLPGAGLTGWPRQLKHRDVLTSTGGSPGPVSGAGEKPQTTLPPLVVAIPARDEAGTIGRALEALGRQAGEDQGSLTVVVLANGCQDETADVARRVARTLPVRVEVTEEVYPPEFAHVGHARGRAMTLAAERLAGHPAGLLATTDADTVVAPDWASRLRLALASADAVGGRTLTLPEERAGLARAVRRLQLQDAAYHLLSAELEGRLDPDPADPTPRHHQHFGANLGLRLTAWQRLGAWPQVRCLEDVALVQELRRLDLRLRHCPHVRAWTSARACGRVEVGLSTQLREWQALHCSGRDWLVPGATERRSEALACAALRRAWLSGQSSAALERLWMVEAGELRAALTASTYGLARELAFGARQRAGGWHRVFPPVPVGEALQGLRALLRESAWSAPVEPMLAAMS